MKSRVNHNETKLTCSIELACRAFSVILSEIGSSCLYFYVCYKFENSIYISSVSIEKLIIPLICLRLY